LRRAEANAVTAFKDLYDVWFDESGNKTQSLKTLEEKGENLTNMKLKTMFKQLVSMQQQLIHK
jgi:hypothetical protein